MAMKESVLQTEEKYVLGLFLDISGAFDGAWWPEIMRVLREWKCPNNLYKLIRGYFDGREVVLNVGGAEAKKRLSQGCPQGSVLGPILWNVLFDSFLRQDYGSGTTSAAYADDGLILVRANSRRKLEELANGALAKVLIWGEGTRLKISKEKTVMILLKGKMHKQRMPIIFLKDTKIASLSKTKYLGVVVETGMKFEAHCCEIGAKAKSLFGRFKRIAKANSGMGCAHLKIIYKGAMEPMLLYGSEFWGEEMVRTTAKRKLMSAQRTMLITMIKGYRTISHDAVRVIAGVIPIDLRVEERVKLWQDKESGMDKMESKRLRREEILEKWQARWDNSDKGRETYKYIKDVKMRMAGDWSTNHYMTQFLSGHGNFKAKLKSFNLVKDDGCVECGVEETAEHVLISCKRFEEERKDLKGLMREKGLMWEQGKMMFDDEVIKEFGRLCIKIGRKKEELEKEEDTEFDNQ